jgi:hypothetical protein
MRTKKILFVLLLLMFPIAKTWAHKLFDENLLNILNSPNNDSNNFLEKTYDPLKVRRYKPSIHFGEDSISQIADSSANFIDLTIFSTSSPPFSSESENKFLNLELGIGIEIGQQYYLYGNYKITESALFFSLGRFYSSGDFRIFPKIGIAAPIELFFSSKFTLLFDFGCDLRYNLMDNINLFFGANIYWGPAMLKFSDVNFVKGVKLGISTNI